jgi:hypothetical protein
MPPFADALGALCYGSRKQDVRKPPVHDEKKQTRWARLNAWMLRTAIRMERHFAEVRLPPGQAVRFFDHCLGCRGAATQCISFRSRGRGDLNVLRRGVGLRGLLHRDYVEVQGPTCARCIAKLRWKQRLHFYGYWASIWLGMAYFVVARFAEMSNPMMGVYFGLGGSAAFILYETICPPEMLVQDRGETIAFTFRRYEDAQLFAERNDTTVH